MTEEDKEKKEKGISSNHRCETLAEKSSMEEEEERSWTRRIVVKQLNHQQAAIVSVIKLFMKSNCSKTFCIIASNKKSRQKRTQKSSKSGKRKKVGDSGNGPACSKSPPAKRKKSY